MIGMGVFALNVGILLGVSGIGLSILLLSIRSEMKSKQVNPDCKCGTLVHLGEWTCEIHGKMVAHKDSRG